MKYANENSLNSPIFSSIYEHIRKYLQPKQLKPISFCVSPSLTFSLTTKKNWKYKLAIVHKGRWECERARKYVTKALKYRSSVTSSMNVLLAPKSIVYVFFILIPNRKKQFIQNNVLNCRHIAKKSVFGWSKST